MSDPDPGGSTSTLSSGSSSAGADDSSGGEIKLDVGAPKGGFGPCGCELAYIWIANADEGTVSKINVRTLEEEGRYITRPDGNGNPKQLRRCVHRPHAWSFRPHTGHESLQCTHLSYWNCPFCDMPLNLEKRK